MSDDHPIARTEDHLPDFAGKLVGIRRGGTRMLVLESPRFEMLGGRLFLIGPARSARLDPSWFDGLDLAVAWDDIEEYFVLGSPEEYERRFKAWKGTKSRSRLWYRVFG